MFNLQISNLSVALPVPLELDNKTVTDAFASCCNPFTSLTPLYDASKSAHTNVNSLVLRGAKVNQTSSFHDNITKWIPTAAR